jgi:transcription termination factor Rho
MHLHDLKRKTPADLVIMAEELGIENASTLRKQDIIFAILKATAEAGNEITGTGTIEVMPDGFGFLRSADSNYLAGPDDVYVTPQIVRKFGLRTGDTIEGEIRAPKDGERYFGLVRVVAINFDDPDVVRHRVNFDNLTPLYPDEKLNLDNNDPTIKDKTGRIIDIVAPLGKGQRCLIVAPPRVGKTMMMQNIARSISANIKPKRRVAFLFKAAEETSS